MFKSNSKCQISLKTDRKYSEKGKMSVTSTPPPPQKKNVLKPHISIGCLNSGWYGKEAKWIL